MDGVHGLARSARQRRHGELRQAVPREVPPAAVTSLRQGLRQDARPRSRWRSLLSAWCVISARVIATVIRSCRMSGAVAVRRLIAAPAACSPCNGMSTTKGTVKSNSIAKPV